MKRYRNETIQRQVCHKESQCKEQNNYKMGDKQILSACDIEAVLTAESENDLQRLICHSHIISKQYNMKILVYKKKTLIKIKRIIRSQIEVPCRQQYHSTSHKHRGICVKEQIIKQNPESTHSLRDQSYSSQIRYNTNKIIRLLQTKQMKILRGTTRKSVHDHEELKTSDVIICAVDNINM